MRIKHSIHSPSAAGPTLPGPSTIPAASPPSDTAAAGAQGATRAAAGAQGATRGGATPKVARLKLRRITLPNGVRILVHPKPGSAVVKVHIGVGAGSLQDVKGREGAAHLIEHLFFQGGKGRSVADVHREIDEQGGKANAYTSQKEIVFHTTAPAREASRAIGLLTDIFMSPSSDPKSLAKEQQIVTNELWQRLGTKQTQASVDFERLLYGDQKLTQLPIGTARSVKAVRSKDVQRFVHKYFNGQNTVVLLEGDPRHLNLEMVKARLSKLPRGRRVDNSKLFDGFRKGALVEVVTDESQAQTSLQVMFPAMGKRHRLGPAAMVLGTILADGFSSRLNESLREKHRLTYGAWGGLQADHEHGYFTVSTDVDSKQVTKAVAEMSKELKAARVGITQAELTRAKRQLINELLIKAGDASARAEGAYEAALERRDLVSPEQLARQLEKVTLADVRAAAAQVIDFRKIKIGAFGPITGHAAIQAGLDQAGVGVKLTNIPFDAKRYAAYLDAGDGAAQAGGAGGAASEPAGADG